MGKRHFSPTQRYVGKGLAKHYKDIVGQDAKALRRNEERAQIEEQLSETDIRHPAGHRKPVTVERLY